MSLKTLRACSLGLLATALLWGCEEPIPDQLNTGLDFITGTPTFSNYADDQSDWALETASMVRLFSEAAVCVPASSPCRLNDFAAAWADDVNQTLKRGHSEGIAMLTLAFQQGQLNPADFGAQSVAALDLSDPRVQREIAYWAATQKIPAGLARDQSFQAKDVMKFLAKAFKAGQKEGWRLAIAMRDETSYRGGHALVPFGFFKGKKEGQFYLRVYDSNLPGREQRLFIDTKANTWSYEGSVNADAPRTYAGDGTNKNLLYFSPLTARVGPFPAPFAEGSKVLAVSADGVGAVLSDEGGARVGVSATGEISESGGTVRPAFAQANCIACPGPSEVMNVTLSPDGGMGGSQRIELNNFGNASSGGGSVNINGSGITASVSGVKTEGMRDTEYGGIITVSGKTIDVNIPPNSNSSTVTIKVSSPDGGVTTVTVNTFPAANVKIDASDPNNVKVTASNNNNTPVTGSITVSTAAGTGGGTVETPINLAGGKSSTTTAAPLSGTVSIFPVPGTDCTNRIWDPRDGGETDVDCGGLCPKCADNKKCVAASDCNSGVCYANRCYPASCNDGIKNGTELDVDCGPSCFGATCRVGAPCSFNSQCVWGLDYNSLCWPQDGGSVCQQSLRRQLRVRGLGAGAQFNLNGTIINGQINENYVVNGTAGADFTVPFYAHRYQFQNLNRSPAPYQSNFVCELENPTNDPELIGRGGFGDGGQPALNCTRVGTTMIVDGKGCYGMDIPLSSLMDRGTAQARGIPITNKLNDTGSLEVGTFRDRVYLSRGAGKYYTTIDDEPTKLVCPAFNYAVETPPSAAVLRTSLTCNCFRGDFRGPTSIGNPCANAVQLLTLPLNTFSSLNGDTGEVSVNEFNLLPDSGCGFTRTARSGADWSYRVNVPAGKELRVGFGGFPGHIYLFPDLASCGTNVSTNPDAGTQGARCLTYGTGDPYGGKNLIYLNSTSAAQNMYVVLDGADVGDQGRYQLDIGIFDPAPNVLGNPCNVATALVPPRDGGYASASGRFLDNLVRFPVDAGCATITSPPFSPNDGIFAVGVPARTRLEVSIGDCTSTVNLLEYNSCGTNVASSRLTGTSGIRCLVGQYPPAQLQGCSRQPVVYENRTASLVGIQVVVESGNTLSTRPAYNLSARLIPAPDLQTQSGPAFLGNPCNWATPRAANAPQSGTVNFDNNFFTRSSIGCRPAAAGDAPSGPDMAYSFSVPPDNTLTATVSASDGARQIPFYSHLIVGLNSCGDNALNYVDAGTTGMICNQSFGPVTGNQTHTYVNNTANTQDVYVVIDTKNPTLGLGQYFTIASSVTGPTPDGGADAGADSGVPDAGPPDAGPPDAGPPDAGPPDAGPPDAGPPDAGPPDAGPPDAGPPDAGGGSFCSNDSQCPGSNNCYCATTPGNCSGTGRCVPGRAVISAPTDGGSVSGTFTIPAGCTQVAVSVWGAGGGKAEVIIPFPQSQNGGPGGYVSGLLPVVPGDVFTAWIGKGGQPTNGQMGDEGAGSYFGVSAFGGFPEVGEAAGGGGGLTSIRQTGSATVSFTVPGGSGAGMMMPGKPGGGMGAGSATTRRGGDADIGSQGGGGGAGDPGGLGATAAQGAGDPGAFGTLPSGLTSSVATLLSVAPPQDGTPNYALCPSNTGRGESGDGCFVLRCTTP